MWTKVKVDENLGSRLKIKFSPVLYMEVSPSTASNVSSANGKKKKKEEDDISHIHFLNILPAVHQIQ